MKIGQKVVRRPTTFQDKLGSKANSERAMSGRVVYIHPRGLYHTVEFALRGGAGGNQSHRLRQGVALLAGEDDPSFGAQRLQRRAQLRGGQIAAGGELGGGQRRAAERVENGFANG